MVFQGGMPEIICFTNSRQILRVRLPPNLPHYILYKTVDRLLEEYHGRGSWDQPTYFSAGRPAESSSQVHLTGPASLHSGRHTGHRFPSAHADRKYASLHTVPEKERKLGLAGVDQLRRQSTVNVLFNKVERDPQWKHSMGQLNIPASRGRLVRSAQLKTSVDQLEMASTSRRPASCMQQKYSMDQLKMVADSTIAYRNTQQKFSTNQPEKASNNARPASSTQLKYSMDQLELDSTKKGPVSNTQLEMAATSRGPGCTTQQKYSMDQLEMASYKTSACSTQRKFSLNQLEMSSTIRKCASVSQRKYSMDHLEVSSASVRPSICPQRKHSFDQLDMICRRPSSSTQRKYSMDQLEVAYTGGRPSISTQRNLSMDQPDVAAPRMPKFRRYSLDFNASQSNLQKQTSTQPLVHPTTMKNAMVPQTSREPLVHSETMKDATVPHRARDIGTTSYKVPAFMSAAEIKKGNGPIRSLRSGEGLGEEGLDSGVFSEIYEPEREAKEAEEKLNESKKSLRNLFFKKLLNKDLNTAL